MKKITLEKSLRKIVCIKIGSSSLVDWKKKIKRSVIKSLAIQTKKLIDDGYGVCIVTSGAVASASNDNWGKNLRAAVGQIKLMNIYANEFKKVGIVIAQGLFTDRELEEKNSNPIKKLFLEAFEKKIVFIINANDVVDSKELNALSICADNDQLFALVCKKLKATHAIMVFSENGFRDSNGDMVHEVFGFELEKYLSFAKGGSALGHGNDGMATKISILNILAQNKINSRLVSVKEEDFIIRAMEDEKNFGTRFL